MASSTPMDAAFKTLSNIYSVVAKDPNNPKAKAQLASAAMALVSTTQSPHEAAMGFIWKSAVHPVYRAAADSDIISEWPKETMTAKELAELTSVEQRLVVRLMRVLTGAGVFKEVGEELYSHNSLSEALSAPSKKSTSKFTWPGTSRLAEYLAATSYRNPGYSPEVATPFQFANQTPLTFYQQLAQNDSARKGFDAQMKAHVAAERAQHQTGFASIFDFEGEVGPLIQSDDDVALVDVGGSQGHVLEDVRKHIPALKGRLVLEELPETLASITAPEGIETVTYNFLESEQPIKGAAIYLFRQIFLNWSDIRGKQILANNLPAMKPGYSKLLIMEPVLPPTGSPTLGLLDMQMAQMGGGLRTSKQWTALLEEAGFEVKRFLPSNSNHTIIEAVPKV